MGDASTPTVAVYLVDAHDLVREGTRAILEREPDIKVAGEQRDAADVVRLVAACHPDVVVVGVGDEADVGLEACQDLSTALPRIPCLVVGHHRPSELVVAAIQAGAKGYVLDESRSSDVVAAVRRLAQGLSSLDPVITSRVLTHLRGGSEARPATSVLSATERKVLELIGLGLTNREIAVRVQLPPAAVKKHVASIFTKLDVRRRTQAAVVAARELGAG